VYDALRPFLTEEIALPPEDEMPVLSPAAREATSASGSAGSQPGSFRQDSAVLRAEIMQRSGRMLGASRSSGMHPAPSGVAVAPSRSGGSSFDSRPGGASSGNMPPAYFEPPPMVSPLGSAAIPPIPNPTRPANETARMAESTNRNAVPNFPAAKIPYASVPRGMHPVLKIILESVLVFGVCLILYFIIRQL
jgi:hypothetical protein